MSAIFEEQGTLAEALERSKRVLALREKALVPGDEGIAAALGERGDIENQQSHWDDAIAYYHRALDIAVKAVGPEHPTVAGLRINLAAALRYKGDHAGALAQLVRAREITARSVGPDHPDIAVIAVDIGGVELADHPPAEGLARARLAQHRKADASALYRRALPLLVKGVGPDDEQTLAMKKTLAQLEHPRCSAPPRVARAKRAKARVLPLRSAQEEHGIVSEVLESRAPPDRGRERRAWCGQ